VLRLKYVKKVMLQIKSHERMLEAKYRPTAWQDFVGNPGPVQLCKDWIKNFALANSKELVPRILIISGPEGCGKSLAADLLLKKQGYKTYSFGVREIKKHKGDRNCLENFCNLYQSNLGGPLGAGASRRNAHGIILEDFDGLTRSDKRFNADLLALFKEHPSPVTPVIITTTENNLSSSSLAKLAQVVYFQKLSIKDLTKIAQRIAVGENFYLDDDQVDIFATNARGDIRQLLLSIEMFYVAKIGAASAAANAPVRVTTQELISYIDEHGVDSEAKICGSAASQAAQTDDERILAIAIVGDQCEKERAAAMRLLVDNSMQFTPYLFQAYVKSVPAKADLQAPVLTAMSTLADIADDFSSGDVIRESMWNSDTDVHGTLAVELPIKRLRGALNLTSINVSGYQTFYGIENTISNQLKFLVRLRELNPTIERDTSSLELMKELYKHVLETHSDPTLVAMLYPLHPEYLEIFGKILKTNSEYVISKARMKRLTKCYDDQLEQHRPAVKFVDATAVEAQRNAKRKRQAENDLNPDDKFVVLFD
jgi:DNA polymerase III delta prime subunit